MKTQWLGWATLAIMAALSRAQAQAPALETMPPAAKAAFDRGVHAVEVQDWTLASRYFAEARKVAPGAPAIALNLGLAYANAGQEPLAIAWLNAFIAADPDGPKAAAARQQVERLREYSGKKLKLLVQAATTAIEQTEGNHAGALVSLARAEAKAGLLNEALATLTRPEIASDNFHGKRAPTETTAEVLSAYADAAREAGDPRRAADALSRVPATGIDLAADSSYGHAWRWVSAEFVKQTDFDRGWRAAKQIPNEEERGKQMAEVAKLRLEEGDYIPAEEAVPLMKEPDRCWLLRGIARAHLNQKDIAGARQAASRMSERTYLQGEVLVGIAQAQFEAGDAAAARTTARQALALGAAADIERDYEATTGVSVETAFQASKLLGDYASALRLAARQKDSPYGKFYEPFDSFAELILWQAIEGRDLNGAVRTARSVLARPASSDPEKIVVGPAVVYGALAVAQVKAGRLADAMASLRIPTQRRDRFAWRVIGIVKDLSAQGNLDRAREFYGFLAGLRGTSDYADAGSQSDLDRMCSMAAVQLIGAQMKAGDLTGAEKIAATVRDPKYRPILQLTLADGYAERKFSAQAVRALDLASQAIAEIEPAYSYDFFVGVPASWNLERNPTLPAAQARIAEMQAALDDPNAAEATRARAKPLVFGPWVDLADDYSFLRESTAVGTLMEEARACKSPGDIVYKLTGALEAYGKTVTRVEVLEAKLAAAKKDRTARL